MKKAFKMATCLVLTIGLLSSLAFANAILARSSAYLNSYRAAVTARSGGTIAVSATVHGRGFFPEIGTSKIVVYESSNGGEDFSLYETYYSDDNSSMMGSGSMYDQTAITFTGTIGNQYKATVYCYAGDSSGSDSKPYYTGVVTAKR